MKQCYLCGRKNENNAQYCQGCGRPLPAKVLNTGMAPSTRIAIVVIILLLGVIGYLLTSRPEILHMAMNPTPEPTRHTPSSVASLITPPAAIPSPIIHKKPTAKFIKAPLAPIKSPSAAPNEMVLIPAGEFTMGSPEGTGLDNEHPAHQVYLDAFYIDKNLVTYDQYDKFCEKTGMRRPDDEGWGRGNRPVVGISWDEATAYASWAGKRLPTEAEYEKAARGGTNSLYFFGDFNMLLDDYVWYGGNAEGKSHPVGQKKPNPYGLYDMLGNVAEWCTDWYGEDYYAASPAKNPKGPDQGTERVLRGGSWWDTADFLRCAKRAATAPGHIYTTNGFRCAKSL
ncbi:MAG TPA: formylglycine-generating enzyme family protein [bacterium]|jgi:formylglycine-generating enzyme required for sulfatase activity|nr:formylglycine-generating enzyme family protein [bacterium]